MSLNYIFFKFDSEPAMDGLVSEFVCQCFDFKEEIRGRGPAGTSAASLQQIFTSNRFGEVIRTIERILFIHMSHTYVWPANIVVRTRNVRNPVIDQLAFPVIWETICGFIRQAFVILHDMSNYYLSHDEEDEGLMWVFCDKLYKMFIYCRSFRLAGAGNTFYLAYVGPRMYRPALNGFYAYEDRVHLLAPYPIQNDY